MICGYDHVAMGAGNIRELHLGNTKAGIVGGRETVTTTFAPVVIDPTTIRWKAT